jgi:hypothetical protein
VPGYSETTDLTPTIGSYHTGGKKAIFRLATEANITTRYWNPSGTSDEAWSIQRVRSARTENCREKRPPTINFAG